MLRFMRKYATGYFIKIVFGLIIASFVLVGYFGYKDREKVLAEVGPYKVSAGEFEQAYRRTESFYRQLFKDKFDAKQLNLREKVMSDLVDRYLLILAAKNMGFTVSDQELMERIARSGNFSRDGRFDQGRYQEILKRSGIDQKSFEELERNTMLAEKAAGVIADIGSSVSEKDLWERYVRERGKVNLGYAQFDPADYKGKVNVTAEEIASVYEKEKGSYRSENTYHLKQVTVEPKNAVKDDKVYLELLKAPDFDGYARKNGLAVADLGTLKESQIDARFKGLKLVEAVRGLKKGEITLPVREGSKSYIFKLVEREEGKPLDKAVVTEEIKAKLRGRKAGEMARGEAQNAIARKEIAAKKETGFISRSNLNIQGLGLIPKEHAEVLALTEKQPVYEKPVEMSGKYVVFAFKGQKAPEKADWEKEKEAFAQAMVGKKREDVLKSTLEAARKKEKVKITWDANE